jgi:Tol biopolymer transport system component
MAGGNLNISAIDLNGGTKRQLTIRAGDNYHPVISSDGRYIVFSSNRTGKFNIWRMNASDGSQPLQLTSDDGNFYPYCTPDNRWVIYEHQSRGTPTLWKVSIDGGEPVQLTREYASLPVVSPDGRFIACRYYIEPGVRGIAILPFEGGTPVKLLPIKIIDWQRVLWSPDGRALTYVEARDGVYNLRSQPLDGGQHSQLTKFQTDRIFSYDWSPDGKQLVCERGVETADVIMVSNYR